MTTTGHDQERDRETAQAAKRLFDESVERLDAATVSRLNRQRQRALAELRDGRSPSRWQLWLPATGVAAGIAAALLVWQQQAVRDVPAVDAATDLDILITGENLEMLEDLEFYAWLESEPTATLPDDDVG